MPDSTTAFYEKEFWREMIGTCMRSENNFGITRKILLFQKLVLLTTARLQSIYKFKKFNHVQPFTFRRNNFAQRIFAVVTHRQRRRKNGVKRTLKWREHIPK